MAVDEETVEKVWRKGHPAPPNKESEWRRDDCGAWIRRDSHGDVANPLGWGWEVDHIKAKERGGSDDISNLRPLQWQNNRSKAAGKSDCVVTSKDNANVWVT